MLERRKIQKVGRSTLSVSLPKNWIHLAGVKPGDVVYLDQGKNGALRIISEKLVQEEKREEYYINCDRVKEPNLLERLIVGNYMQGVDIIKIFSQTRINGKQIEEVRNIAQRLVGLSILEISRKEIILHCMIDPSKFQIHSLTQRLSVISSTMLNDAMEALLELNPELANDVIKMENEANNIYWLITRLLLFSQKSQTIADQIGFNNFLTPVDIRLVSKNLETIADCTVSIAKIALDLHRITHDERIRDEIDKKELEKMPFLDQLTREVFQKAVDSLFSRDLISANHAINLGKELDAKVEAIMRTATIPYFRAIAIMLAIIIENSSSIASMAFDLELKASKSFPDSNSGLSRPISERSI